MLNKFRSLFPLLTNQSDLAYLDNAATTQRPAAVIQAINDFYFGGNANVHRGVYDLSNQASAQYDLARDKAAQFFGTQTENVAFTSGTTDSINRIARSFLAPRLKPGDNIVTTILEHHSNFIPWQQLAIEKGVEFRVAPITPNGDLDLKKLDGLLDANTKMLAVTHISNTLGTINPLAEIVEMAHKKDVPVTVDAAQSAAFYELKQSAIKYDLLACSAHKMFGPFGVGLLVVSDEYRDQFQPHNFGGGMIRSVTIEKTDFAKFPTVMEAGTPNVEGVIGFSAAIDFLNGLDRNSAKKEVDELGEYCREVLGGINEVEIIGHPTKRSGIVSFTVENIHPHDVASFLNKDGIAVRAGMHCTQPLLQSLGVHATVRASFSIYNDKSEIDRLGASLRELIKFWS